MPICSVTSHSPDIYTTPPPTSPPYSSQAQDPTPLISPGTVRALAASTRMIIQPNNGTSPSLAQTCLGGTNHSYNPAQ